jgi:glycosyltransferase involved in cell wall biosynthesis
MKRFRVMHVISNRNVGGTERMLTHLVPNFDKEQFESCLVCFNSPSILTKEWEQAGIEVHHLNMDRPVSITGIVRLLRFMRDWKPDILFVYGLRANLMARAARLFYRIPVLITCQRGIEDWKGKLAVFLEKTTSIFVDRYIGVSKACCDMLATREKIPSRKLKVIHNGISLVIPDDVQEKAKTIKREYHYPEGAFIVGSVGRMHSVKGHEYLIDAAEELAKKYPNLFFVLVGKDHRNGELQKRVEKKGLTDKFLFAGYHKEVVSWLATFDLFVLPSLSEGLPTVVLEAFFMQCPVVATDVGGTGEAVEHEKTGLLIPPADSRSLADAIRRLYEDSDLRNRLRWEGFKKANDEFTVKRMVQQYEETAKAIYFSKIKKIT